MRAVAIIPAFDEEQALPAVLAELRATLPHLDVVVVDDGSRDATARAATKGGAAVLRLPFNLGIGGALRAGFKHALAGGYDAAIQLDADGQHDPAAIQTLLAEIASGADLAVGNRFGAGTDVYDAGRTRLVAMRLLRLAVRALSGRSFTDTSSGFRAFSRPMLEHFALSYPIEYLESVESLVLAVRAGFDVREVPTSMRPRQGGAPSSRRLRLAYHYVRLLVVLATSAGRRKAPA